MQVCATPSSAANTLKIATLLRWDSSELQHLPRDSAWPAAVRNAPWTRAVAQPAKQRRRNECASKQAKQTMLIPLASVMLMLCVCKQSTQSFSESCKRMSIRTSLSHSSTGSQYFCCSFTKLLGSEARWLRFESKTEQTVKS